MLSRRNNQSIFCWFLGNLTIKSQILIISFLFSTMILGILLGAVLISYDYISQALQNASNKIFATQTQGIMNFIWIHQHGMEELISKTAHRLSTVRNLNNFAQQGRQFVVPKPKMCLQNQNDMDSYCFTSSMCCGVFGTQLNSELETQLENIMITTSLIDVLRLEYDFSGFSPISYSFNNSAQLYCFSAGFPFPSTFKPHSRPYYLETLKQMLNSTNPKQFYFTSPYSTLTSKIRCPMTTALLDLEQQFVGLVANDLDFNYTQIEKKNLDLNNYILAQDGKVVFTDKYRIPSQPVFYLNESQYSGFDQQDYEQIMYQHYGQQFQSNCNNFNFDNILCRYNSLMEDNVIVRTANISNSPYILVQLSQTNTLREQESIHLKLLNQQLSSQLRWSIIIIVIISIGIIVFCQVLTNIILKQLNNSIKRIGELIHQNYSKKLSKYWRLQGQKDKIQDIFSQDVVESNCVTNLQSAFNKIFSNINSGKKSDECRIQENLPYPHIDINQSKNLKGIKQMIQFLKNHRALDKIRIGAQILRKLLI